MKWNGDIMNISKNKGSAWQKIVNSKNWHIKILMLALFVFSSMFFMYKLNARADDNENTEVVASDPELSPSEKRTYGEVVEEGGQKYYYMHIEGGTLPSEEDIREMLVLNSDGSAGQGGTSFAIDRDNRWIRIWISEGFYDSGAIQLARGGVGLAHAPETVHLIKYENEDEKITKYTANSTNVPYKDEGNNVAIIYLKDSYDGDGNLIQKADKYDAICFDDYDDFKKQFSFSASLFNCTIGDVSVYRVFRRDNEEKRVKLSSQSDAYDNTVIWTDTRYVNGNRSDWNPDGQHDQFIKYEAVFSDGDYKVYNSDGDSFVPADVSTGYYQQSFTIQSTAESTVVVNIDPFISLFDSLLKAPKIVVKDESNNNISDLFDDSNDSYEIIGDVDLARYTIDDGGEVATVTGYSLSNFKISLRSGVTKYLPIKNDNIKVWQYDRTSSAWKWADLAWSSVGEDGSSVGNITGMLIDNNGNLNLRVKAFERRIWIGSENAPNTPWQNATLKDGYELKVQVGGSFVDLGISPSTDYTKGAWYYDYFETITTTGNSHSVSESSFKFQMSAKVNDGYGFTTVENNVTASSGTLSGVSHTEDGKPDYNEDTIFTIAPVNGETLIQVKEQMYIGYVNTFEYVDDTYNLTEVADMKVASAQLDRQGNKFSHTWNISSPSITYSVETLSMSGKVFYAIKNSKFEISGISGNEICEKLPDSSNFATNRGFTLSNLKLENHNIKIAGIIAAPKLRILNLNDSNSDITDDGSFKSNYRVEFEYGFSTTDGFTIDDLTVKNKNNDYAKPDRGDFSIVQPSGASVGDYDPVSGKLYVSGYDGGDIDLGIKPFKRRIWVGSENETSWLNQTLPNGYVLKVRSGGNYTTEGIKLSESSDNFKNGAWYYDYYESLINDEVTNSSIDFRLLGKRGYEFESLSVTASSDSGENVVSNTSLDYATADEANDIGGEDDPAVKGKNSVGFTVTNASGESKIKVAKEQYTTYQSIFKYKIMDFKLSDFVTMGNITTIDDDGNYIQSWTVGSAGGSSFSTYCNVSTKNNYIINGDTFIVQIEERQGDENVDFISPYGRTSNQLFSLENLLRKDHVIYIDGIEAVRKMNFSAGNEFAIVDKDGGTYTKSENKYTLDSAYLKLSEDKVLKYQVTIKNDDSRIRFNGDNNEIAEALKNSNSGTINECSVVKSDDNSEIVVDLTFAYNNAINEYNLTIPDSIISYRDCNVKFDMDLTPLAGSVYYGDISGSIKIKKTSNNKQVNLSLVNGHLRSTDSSTKVSYDDLKYEMTIDAHVIDLRKLKLTLDGNTDPGGEVTVDRDQGQYKIVFKLNHLYKIGENKNADYRSTVTFYFGADEVMGSRDFYLCPNVVLYEMGNGTDDTKRKIDFAEYEEVSTKVEVPINGENTFIAQYVDYSQTFGVENIEFEDEDGNPVGAGGEGTYKSGRTEITLESAGFNTVKIKVVDSDPEQGDETKDIKLIKCVSPIPTSPPLRFNAIGGAKYYNLTEDGKIDLSSPIEGTINALKGQDFSFAVQCDGGYDPETLSVKANKNTFSEDNDEFKKVDVFDDDKYKYSLFTIKGDKMIYPYVISGSINIKQLSIQFTKNLGNDFGTCEYVYNGSNVGQEISVLYGEGISFEVQLPDKCNQSDINVVFTKADTSEEIGLEKVSGKYVLNNISSSGVISIKPESLKINQYPITFKANDRSYYRTKDGGNLSGTVNVDYNGDYSFRVYANSGYTLDGAAVSLKYSDGTATTLEPDGSGVYNISHIMQPCTISVDNVEDLVYNVTLEPVMGVTYLNGSDNVIKDTIQVKHGNNFEFAVVLDDAYDDSKAGMNIIVNGGMSAKSSAQKLASGRYVINNVVEDINIKVGNVRKNTYTVTLTGAEGIDYYDASGKIITGDNSVEHHADFSFKVELYPAYADSDITVMLGDSPMSAGENGFYTIPKLTENKTVTVVGIEQTDETELINKINSLPDNITDLSDVDDVIAATKQYEALPDDKKALVTNADKLKALQEQVKAFHHISNDVKIDGVDWYIKLYAIPIIDDVEACGKIYKKLNNEYILSLYNVYLWNTLEDTRYTLPEGQTAVITLPTPDMTYFEGPTAIHEKDTGKLDFISLSINGDKSVFETDSFGPMGIVANRSSTPGRSSLLDAADANLDAISQFAASAFGNDTKKVYNTSSQSDLGVASENDLDAADGDDASGNIDEKFRSRNNRVTAMGSALRLILVLMIILLIVSLIVFFVRRQKEKEEKSNNS